MPTLSFGSRFSIETAKRYWSPALCEMVPRITHDGMQPANVYEIDLPLERQPIADDRFYGEIGTREKSTEVVAMLKTIGRK